MDQNIKLRYDQKVEGFRPKSGHWWDASHRILGLIEGIVEGETLPPQEKVARVQYVLSRFHELLEEEAQKWRL